MPAISITDLNNAKTDVDKINEFMESASATMTTRLGATVQTRAGLAAQFPNAEPAAEEAAESAAAAAADRARAAAERLRAERVRDSLQEASDATYVELLAGRTSGLSIDMTRDDLNLAVKVLDTVTPANDMTGPLSNLINTNTSFPTPRLCKQEDGTYKFNPHNDVLQSNDFGNASWTKTALTPNKNQTGPHGAANAAHLLTTTGVLSHMRQTLNTRAGIYRRRGFKVKAGTAGFVYITLTDNAVAYTAYFNMSTLAFATVNAALTAEVSSLDDDGTAMDAGWRYISVYKKNVASSVELRLGLADADNNTAVTNGVTVIAADAEDYNGVKRLPYMETTAAAVRDTPVDWTPGRPGALFATSAEHTSRDGDNWAAASWTAVNVTPTYPDSTGPHGEPCSSFAATAGGGTIEQAVTSSGTDQTIIVFLKRKTGTGTLEWSIDSGATYTDITAAVDAASDEGEFYMAWAFGAVANPTVKFRVGTSGDAFYGSMLDVSKKRAFLYPVVAGTANFTTSTDVFNVPATDFELGAQNTMYADVWFHESVPNPLSAAGTHFGFFGAGAVRASIQFASLNVDGGITRVQHFTDDGTSRNFNVGELSSGSPSEGQNHGRLQMQLRVAANNHAFCYNGNAPYVNTLPGAQTLTSLQFTVFGAATWLHRLVAVPEGLNDEDDELRTWHLDDTDPNVNRNLLAAASVAKCVPGSGGILRSPAICKLYERGDICEFITFWGERNTSGYNLEAPQRLMKRKWQFNRATNELIPITNPTVHYQDARWAAGLGGVGGGGSLKITEGPYRGRVLTILMQQDSVSGDNSDDARNMYMHWSDDNCDNYTAPVKIFDKSEFVGASAGFVSTGDNSTIFQITDPAHPNYGRVYFSLNGGNENHYAVWTDEFKQGAALAVADQPGMARASWTKSTTPVNANNPGGNLTEPAITFWPNGNIVMLFRNNGGGDNYYAISTDYGVNFGLPDHINGDSESANCNVGCIQDDSTGKLGRYGRIIYAHCRSNPRIHHRVKSSFTSDLNFDLDDVYHLFPRYLFEGYCPLMKAFTDDNIYIIQVEVQPNVISNIDTSHQVVAFRY